jgi:hypothetical protein
LKAIPQIVSSLAHHWNINGDNNGRISGPFGSFNQLPVDIELMRDVQLEKPIGLGSGS